MKIDTLAIHAGSDPADASAGPVIPPLQLSTTFRRDEEGNFSSGYMYTRHGNPTRTALEKCLAALEGGEDAACFSSGSAAAMAVFQALEPGDHVIVPEDMYMGIQNMIREVMTRWQLEFSFVNFDRIRDYLKPRTRLIWIETPSNPLMKVTDIRAVTALAAEKGITTVCDNTFATPVFQRPLELGADLVMHSSTKYMGGHSDVLGGAIICRQRGDFFDRIRQVQTLGGGVLSPFDCYLTLRGIKTLACRMRVHDANAMQLAGWLAAHPQVEKVFHPGLPHHPGHETARSQMSGYGGMLSFLVRGGRAEAMKLINNCRLFTHATSLGGVESLIEHRASQEGPGSLSPENLLRVSTGIENIDDLIEDLERGFHN
ncbi:cystathionine gamma-synthase [Anseongella ginsenosidimutans]|uniref:Cystathionine gamma-synthase n=1 Tax=Anseongella ginsenosidimutans TaxID=496056 RepID=A0A4R3KSU6_9SPHI|nr:PLP-dependent aspartate aminotransferase family protein [Anseongella ginsenosidimutans]QEC53325.1 PLP-dependent transferase [Anseongella ginsenosidimutans]TCS88204.1 cystathionine gamma-synthase [Anseongella ginsenosidimutans]